MEDDGNPDLIQHLQQQSNHKKLDLETVLIDELTRYLEGESGALADANTAGHISLRGITRHRTRHQHHEDLSGQAAAILDQIDRLGLDFLETLAANVEIGVLSIEEALSLAFHYGRHNQPEERQGTRPAPAAARREQPPRSGAATAWYRRLRDSMG